MFRSATRGEGHWQGCNDLGDELRVPERDAGTKGPILIGVMGTRRRSEVSGPVTRLLAMMLAAVAGPIYLLDVRRDGTGGQSSHSPREFGSLIPQALPADKGYAFIHLPCL